MIEKKIDDIHYIIEELMSDSFTSKTVRLALEKIEEELKKENNEQSLMINRILNLLEEVSEDTEMPAHIRIHLLNISSILESF